MKKEEIEKFLADTKVYVNGKSKEIQKKLFSFGYRWNGGSTEIHRTEKPFIHISECKTITFGDDMEYFTKHENREITAEDILSLELDKPKYRPFKSIEECYNEMLKHQPFGWVKGNSGICYNIATVDKTSVYFFDGNQCFYKDALENHFFMDGTPFAIKEE